nr:hypothetical protein CFP56_72639 [Quercus suber]
MTNDDDDGDNSNNSDDENEGKVRGREYIIKRIEEGMLDEPEALETDEDLSNEEPSLDVKPTVDVRRDRYKEARKNYKQYQTMMKDLLEIASKPMNRRYNHSAVKKPDQRTKEAKQALAGLASAVPGAVGTTKKKRASKTVVRHSVSVWV